MVASFRSLEGWLVEGGESVGGSESYIHLRGAILEGCVRKKAGGVVNGCGASISKYENRM